MMRQSQSRFCFSQVFGVGAVLGTVLWCAGVMAATPDTAPPELKAILTQIDSAANRQDINAVMDFYSQSFSHSDGLTRENLQNALVEFWKRYPQISYRTELQSWQVDGKTIVAETVTQIIGKQSNNGREFTLNAMLRSRQRYEEEKIVQQEILTERSEVTTGPKPPTLQIKLPNQIKVGQQYSFDAVVQEPLEKDLLLGSALEEPVKPETYLNPAPIELELLQAGGLFKVGNAPAEAQPRWFSAIVVRKDGMTAVTQRVNMSK